MLQVRVFDEDGMETRAVAVMEQTLLDTQRAFDGVASAYDRSNADSPTLCGMRRRTLAAVAAHVPAGGRIIDLGCGPGADDEALARAGYRVTAIDWSSAMVEETRKRIARAGLQDALYGWRGNWARLRVRFARQPVAVPLNGRTVWTSYYTPGEFERTFAAAGFTRVSLRTLGLFVPPPYMDRFAARHTSLVARLQRLEDRVGGWPGLRAWGDHFLMVLRKA